MARHGFGRGEYKYFAYPLPDTVARLRAALYPPLAAIANRWNAALGIASALSRRSCGLSRALPSRRADQADAAAAALWRRRLQLPAPGSLRRACVSAAGDDSPVVTGQDFTGGEFVLAEQRPRRQSRAEVVPLAQGDARRLCRARAAGAAARAASIARSMRHGVSRVRSGPRMTLGIIFHDAQ